MCTGSVHVVKKNKNVYKIKGALRSAFVRKKLTISGLEWRFFESEFIVAIRIWYALVCVVHNLFLVSSTVMYIRATKSNSYLINHGIVSKD